MTQDTIMIRLTDACKSLNIARSTIMKMHESNELQPEVIQVKSGVYYCNYTELSQYLRDNPRRTYRRIK